MNKKILIGSVALILLGAMILTVDRIKSDLMFQELDSTLVGIIIVFVGVLFTISSLGTMFLKD